jgi:hypothetical protein
MPQVQHIDVEVRPSQGYQTVGFTARIVFDTPASLDEAKFEADLTYHELEELALKRISNLKGKHQQEEVAPIAHLNGSSAAANTSGLSLDWKIGYKPNGAGSFRYPSTLSYSKERFIEEAKKLLPGLGIPADEVVIFDDRGGTKGIEAGNEYYCAGKVKARQESKLNQAMQGKSIVANIDFGDDGTLKMSLSRDGKTAMQAMAIASQFATLGAIEQSTPF